MELKNDKYKRNRGGHSRLLDITCTKCKEHLFYYQKDGPGILKRLYLDRIFGANTNDKKLVCGNCKELLGVQYVYKKEKRLAYRLFSGAVNKKIVSKSKIYIMPGWRNW